MVCQLEKSSSVQFFCRTSHAEAYINEILGEDELGAYFEINLLRKMPHAHLQCGEGNHRNIYTRIIATPPRTVRLILKLPGAEVGPFFYVKFT